MVDVTVDVITKAHKEEEEDLTSEGNIEDPEVDLTQNPHQGKIKQNLFFLK